MSQTTPWRQLRSVVKTLERLASETVNQDHANAMRGHADALEQLARTITPVNPPDALTPAQSRILIYIRRYIAEHSHAPTRKEISDAFGFASPTAAHQHVKVLERKGILTLIEGAARGIRLNKRTAAQIASDCWAERL
jgi:DNA-binding MarR family transcriptional regulator